VAFKRYELYRESSSDNNDPYVYKRQDVGTGKLITGTLYRAENEALRGGIGLIAWIIAAYFLIWLGLIRAEPETLRPAWAKSRIL
jgi:hypothetical protein